MTSEPGESEERRWLLEPPAPGTAEVIFRIGEGATLTPDVQQAFDQFLQALGAAEVQGYAAPSSVVREGCGPFQTSPCEASFSTCMGLGTPSCPQYPGQCTITICMIKCQPLT